MNVLQPPNAFFLVGLIVYFWIRHGFIMRTKTEKKIVSHMDAVEKLLLGLVMLAVLFLPLLYLFSPLLSFADYPLPWPMRWAGGLTLIASLWLFRRSHVDLGQNWSVSLEVREHHELISTGVYRSVRHPMYASDLAVVDCAGIDASKLAGGVGALSSVCGDVFHSPPS